MAPPQQLRQQTSNCSLLLIYRPRKDERLSWLTCSGWFTHLSGHPSATGRAQDSESTPAKDRRYIAGPRNQPTRELVKINYPQRHGIALSIGKLFVQIGCLPYFHTWCGLIANLGCRFETCCMRLTENTGRKKSPSGHHHTNLSGNIFATKARINNRKKTC